MNNILITGATGNVGFALLQHLQSYDSTNNIVAGVRYVDKCRKSLKVNNNVCFRSFDFENPDTFDSALANIDCVFLLRPPHISEVERVFRPLFIKMQEKRIERIVFLSVQGAEKSKVIPHNKIERLIVEFGFDYVFVRPSYFMQNLTTTLLNDIRTSRKIILPAANAKFNWIDVEDIAQAAALLIVDFSKYKNKAYEITGSENKNFAQVCDVLNKYVQNPIQFQSVNPLRFYLLKCREGMKTGMIAVMIMLHFLPRLQAAPHISNFFEQLVGRKPNTLDDFVKRELSTLQ